jgi:hypothetical protein
MTLEGDLYNSSGYAEVSAPPGPPPAASIIRAADDGQTSALNLGVSFENVSYTGRISSSKASHSQKTITPSEYNLIGMVTNVAQAGINNGVSVTLAGNSTWTVTGTSYINRLDIGAGCQIKASSGQLVMTKDGTAVTPEAGKSYTGNIKLELN